MREIEFGLKIQITLYEGRAKAAGIHKRQERAFLTHSLEVCMCACVCICQKTIDKVNYTFKIPFKAG